MAEELTLMLPPGIARLGLTTGQDEPTETLAELEARLREEFQQTLAAMDQQHQAELAAWQSADAALRSAIEQLDQQRSSLVDEARQAAVDLAIKIAEKVVMQELDRKDFSIDPIITEAISQMPGRGEIEIRLHPDDLARCSLAGDEQLAHRNIRFVPDPLVAIGGCVVDSQEGCVESTVTDSLNQARKAMQDVE